MAVCSEDHVSDVERFDRAFPVGCHDEGAWAITGRSERNLRAAARGGCAEIERGGERARNRNFFQDCRARHDLERCGRDAACKRILNEDAA